MLNCIIFTLFRHFSIIIYLSKLQCENTKYWSLEGVWFDCSCSTCNFPPKKPLNAMYKTVVQNLFLFAICTIKIIFKFWIDKTYSNIICSGKVPQKKNTCNCTNTWLNVPSICGGLYNYTYLSLKDQLMIKWSILDTIMDQSFWKSFKDVYSKIN
jgi:hypothetical protein